MPRNRYEHVARPLAALGAMTLLAVGCHQTSSGGGPTPGSGPFASRTSGGPGIVATEPGTGQPAPLEPDPQTTPGATLPVTKDDICVSGYSGKVRNVPQDVKNQAYANYNITQHSKGDYEVDHLISLELGGSNSIKNLWPQSYRTQPWNAHVKDQLENKLHEDVCSDRIDLATAQHEVATDWIAAYKQEFHTQQPQSLASGGGGGRRHEGRGRTAAYVTPLAPPAPNSEGAGGGGTGGTGQVWVNLRSGKYFQPGSRYYGNTKQGEYLSEADARRQGYVAAQGQGGQ